jgi:adenylate cyclase
VLAADVAGYSRLMARDELGTLEALKSVRRAVVDPAIADHKGRIVKTTGDGMLVEFASAVDAITCAMAVQAKMAERNGSFSPAITFRIGINIGDIIIDGDDIFGDGVNVAARVENECEPGGVCLSGSAFEQVRGKTGFAFDDLGERSLKNIDRPVRLYAARIVTSSDGTAPARASHEPLPLPDKPSIAVLPFQNMSGDQEQEYFADGIVEDVITALSRFKSLFVIARNSSFTYKGKAVDIKQVGRELGVRYVLEGSVRRAGGKVRITAQLIEAAQNNHLWAEKLDGELGDIFALQDRLTMNIVSSVATRLEQTEIDRIGCKPTTHLGAYDLYLRGMAWQRHERRFDDAYKAFCQASALDSNFAAAYALAAYCLFAKQATQGSPLSAEARADAIRLARLAAKLGQEDAHALARAAHVLANLGNHYDMAKELSDRAVVLNPSMGFAWLGRGWISIMLGEGADALASFTTVLRLDPLDPAKAGAWAGLACAHNLLGDFEAGCQWAQRAVDANPEIWTLAYFIINAVPAGRLGEARQAVNRMLELKPALMLDQVLLACHTKDEHWFEKMKAAFIEAGVPE